MTETQLHNHFLLFTLIQIFIPLVQGAQLQFKRELTGGINPRSSYYVLRTLPKPLDQGRLDVYQVIIGQIRIWS